MLGQEDDINTTDSPKKMIDGGKAGVWGLLGAILMLLLEAVFVVHELDQGWNMLIKIVWIM